MGSKCPCLFHRRAGSGRGKGLSSYLPMVARIGRPVRQGVEQEQGGSKEWGIGEEERGCRIPEQQATKTLETGTSWPSYRKQEASSQPKSHPHNHNPSKTPIPISTRSRYSRNTHQSLPFTKHTGSLALPRLSQFAPCHGPKRSATARP